MLQGSSGGVHSFTQGAELDVVNYHPPAGSHESRDPKQIQRGPRMLMVRIDEDQLEFSGPRDLFDMASVFAGMHADPARQVGNKLRNLEANRFGLIGYATLAEIDCVHDHRLRFRRQVLGDRVSHYGRREAAQRADLHHPLRCENADDSMKKQQVAHSDRPGGVTLVREQMFQSSTLSWDHRRGSTQIAGELCHPIFILVEGRNFAHHWLDRGRQRLE
jgi:hypothetical protein